MTAYETYRYYRALRLHFTSESYDFKQFHGRTKNATLLKNSKEERWCNILCKKYKKQVPNFFLANLSFNPNYYLFDLANEPHCEKVFEDWYKGRKSSIKILENELENVNKSEFLCESDNQIPVIFKKYIQNKISKESLCIVLKTKPEILESWNKSLFSNIFWKQEKLAIEKYLTFIPDKIEYKGIIDCFFNKNEV